MFDKIMRKYYLEDSSGFGNIKNELENDFWWWQISRFYFFLRLAVSINPHLGPILAHMGPCGPGWDPSSMRNHLGDVHCLQENINQGFKKISSRSLTIRHRFIGSIRMDEYQIPFMRKNTVQSGCVTMCIMLDASTSPNDGKWELMSYIQ